MNQEQAKQLIIKTFENPFREEEFTRFLRNLLKSYEENTFTYQGNYIPDAFAQYIALLKRIGKYTYDDKEIDLLIVNLKRENSLERARTAQRNFIAWYLKGSRGGKLKDAALVAFVSPGSDDWRFSLVKMDYRFEETPSGKTKVKEEFTPAKRWSFLVGKNEKSHTAQSRFIKILENDEIKPKLEDLEDAFNVEVATKEFFQKYRELFIRTKLELDEIVKKNENVKNEFEKKNINTVDFTKKFLGQITFLYFLQKKGWFGVERGKPWGTGSKDFIRRLFNKEFGNYKNFYNDILEPLFYEALRTDRSSADHYYSRFNCKLPFLNGGLFDPINNYNWVDTEILIPNELFSNTKRTKEGDIGDGILDVFDRYNFTVNEEEPLEREVALDPELLGKIYEKLNAIRNDNFDEYVRILKSGRKGEETKFNKEYGVYYTPREIVHYMCQQSLINYLATELDKNISKEDIEKFVKLADSVKEHESMAIKREERIKSGEQRTTRYENLIPKSIIENAKSIDKLLDDIRVCDPAVGSGAFPIGMMHEIVRLRHLLAEYLGEQAKPYDLKRHCIEKSLYGVDIDPGAVEICKLRFWLSMIVDEDDFHIIKPLPNLDYKVVCGDSLMKAEKKTLYKPLYINEEHIEGLKSSYFNETNPVRKHRLKNEIDYEIANWHKEFDFKVYFSEVFHQKSGFDIVIANPPYIQLQKDGGRLAKLYEKQEYKTFSRTGDIYTLFYEKGINLLKDNGILCFITSNKWMRAGYGEKLREYFTKYNPLLLVDLGPGVFESATVDTNILLIQKCTNQNKLKAVTYNDKNAGISEVVDKEAIVIDKLTKGPWFIAGSAERRLKEKIERIGKPLKEWDVKIYRGILTGFNEAFIITTEKRNEILSNCRDEEERKRTEAIIKPILRGRDIKRYYYEWAGLWVIFIPWHFPLHEYTGIQGASKKAEKEFERQYSSLYGYLLQFKEQLLERNKDETGIRYEWYALQRCAATYYTEFEKEKVVWGNISYDSEFCFVESGIYINAPANFITSNKTSIKYLIAQMNSKIFDWQFKQIGIFLGHAYEWKKQYVEQVRIPPITPANQPIVKQIEELVDKILCAKKVNPQADTSEFEKQINYKVYELYGLNYQEMKIIEESI